MELVAGHEPYHRQQAGAVGLHRQHQARARGQAIHQHRARAAHAVLAADVGAGEPEILAQEIDEQLARLAAALARLGVDGEPDGDGIGHQRPPMIALARRSARPVSTRVRLRRYAADAWMSESGSTNSPARVAAASTEASERPSRSSISSAARIRIGTGPAP